MAEAQRYSQPAFRLRGSNVRPIPLVPDATGQWVKAADHLATLESLAASLEERRDEEGDEFERLADDGELPKAALHSARCGAFSAAVQAVRSYLGDEGRG